MLAACRFRDLTPGGNRHDDAAVQSAATQFYQALGARSEAALDSAALPAATALLATTSTPVLVPMRTMIDVPERRNQGNGARVLRSELHSDGAVGTDRVVVTARGSDGRTEYEATDLLTLARVGRQWKVAHAAMGPWHLRSAP